MVDEICEAVMHDDEGLLQQFVEYMIGPIMTSSIHQIEDEQSWKQASQSLPAPNLSMRSC